MRQPETAYLGLGSNLGDRLDYLRRAVKMLQAHPDIRISGVSSIYETAPVGPVEQPDFLNMVVAAETILPPKKLFSVTQEIEKRLHRVRTVRWGPRTLDIDILLYGNLILQQEGLILPHPRMEERAFVLIPLLEVAGNLRIPGSGATVRERIEEAPDRSGVRKTPHRIPLTPDSVRDKACKETNDMVEKGG